MKHPGDPTPRSASEILADRGSKMVFSEQSPHVGGQLTNTVVVMHCAIAMRIEPVVETRTSY